MLTQEAAAPPAPPARRAWGFWPTAGFSAVIIITYFAAQVAAGFILFIIKLRAGGLDFEAALESLATDGVINSVAIVAAAALGALLVYAFIKLRGGVSFAGYLGFKKPGWKAVLVSILVFVAMLALAIFIGMVAGADEDSEFTTELYTTSFLPLLVLAVVFIAPLFEEIFFRGFLFVGLRASRLGAAGAVIITSVIWAAIHLQYSLYGMAQILVMGLALGVVRHKTDSLWNSVLIHALWNGAVLAATAIAVSSGGG